MGIEVLWLAAMIFGGAYWLRRDIKAYERFVLLEDSAARQRHYGIWIVQSFSILTGASIISLWLAGGLVPFLPFPAPFAEARVLFNLPQGTWSTDMKIGIAIGIAINLTVVGLIQRWRWRNMMSRLHGPIEPMVPRNRREAVYALLLSLNAGFSEELFFRLALPLLLYQISGSLLFAFALSTLCFGLAHAYQGWKGILATMAVGVLFVIIYLKTGSLFHIMLLHALIDIVAFFVRPAIMRTISRRFSPPEAVRPL